jgi:acyl-coenzyme A thioesterase PaaI-like protein
LITILPPESRPVTLAILRTGFYRFHCDSRELVAAYAPGEDWRMRSMAVDARRLKTVETVFGIAAAGVLLADILPPWMLDLNLLVETVEAGRPPGAPVDWQPGVVLRLPFSNKLSREGVLCPQALMAVADTAMTLACAAAWNGHRPMSVIDQTMHFLRPVSFDVLADARIVRIGRTTSFGRVSLSSAVDRRLIGTVSSAYAIL